MELADLQRDYLADVETRPDAIYNREREVELATLTDERVKNTVTEEGIRLINYRDYARMSREAR